jgi:hypothetical protein
MILITAVLCLGALGLFVFVLTKLFAQDGPAKGLLGLFFPPYALYWGWQYSRREGLQTVMFVWTALLVLVVLGALWVGVLRPIFIT